MTDPARQRRAPRRVSRQRYWMRRIGVLALLGLIGYSLGQAVVAIVSDDGGSDDRVTFGTDSDDGAADDPGADADAGAGEVVGEAQELAAAATSTVAETEVDTTTAPETTTPPTEPERTGPPSTANPASVYIVGDSDAGTFGPYLQELLDATAIVDTDLNYKVSSGLARPDFFDWPAELRTKLPEVGPDIVVVTFGGNDSQGLSLPQDDLEFLVGDPLQNEEEWTAEYARRVSEIVDILLENDRRVVWVGIPNDDNEDVTARLALQDQAVREALADYPEVIFVDTWSRFSGRDGGWAEFVVDPRDGEGKDVRASDGFHLNVTGAEILAIDVAVAVREHLREMGANI
ncbi:MAG: DUF459 domain-containing protein [Actinomycetota bacterium]